MADAPDTERQAVNPDSRAVLSVSQLNDRIASVVEETPALHGVRCIGEVTDLHQNSTALYFTLTDGNAELPCMLWANRYRNMDVDLEDGTEVILEGDIDYWVEGGKIDLKPWEVIVVGDGDQAAAVERLRSELEERGWFDDEQKQRPPAFPERVGVVTSLRGDARYDIQNAIHEQDPTVDILIKDATVQGSGRADIHRERHPPPRPVGGRRRDYRRKGRGAIRTSKRSTPSESRRRSSPRIPRWSPQSVTLTTG